MDRQSLSTTIHLQTIQTGDTTVAVWVRYEEINGEFAILIDIFGEALVRNSESGELGLTSSYAATSFSI